MKKNVNSFLQSLSKDCAKTKVNRPEFPITKFDGLNLFWNLLVVLAIKPFIPVFKYDFDLRVKSLVFSTDLVNALVSKILSYMVFSQYTIPSIWGFHNIFVVLWHSHIVSLLWWCKNLCQVTATWQQEWLVLRWRPHSPLFIDFQRHQSLVLQIFRWNCPGSAGINQSLVSELLFILLKPNDCLHSQLPHTH